MSFYRAPPLSAMDSHGKTVLITCVFSSVVEEFLSIPHCFTMPGSNCCVKNSSSNSHDTYGKHRNNGIKF